MAFCLGDTPKFSTILHAVLTSRWVLQKEMRRLPVLKQNDEDYMSWLCSRALHLWLSPRLRKPLMCSGGNKSGETGRRCLRVTQSKAPNKVTLGKGLWDISLQGLRHIQASHCWCHCRTMSATFLFCWNLNSIHGRVGRVLWHPTMVFLIHFPSLTGKKCQKCEALTEMQSCVVDLCNMGDRTSHLVRMLLLPRNTHKGQIACSGVSWFTLWKHQKVSFSVRKMSVTRISDGWIFGSSIAWKTVLLCLLEILSFVLSSCWRENAHLLLPT